MSHPDPLYDDYNDFHDEDAWNEFDSWDEDYDENEEDDVWDDGYNDSMDGDFDSAMRDAGCGTDEDYGYYGEDY